METNVINATEEFLRNQITELQERVKTVEESHARVVQRDFNTSGALNAMSQSLREWTIENLENRAINDEQAQELADIGGFELTKEVEAEVSVTYYMSLEVPVNVDPEEVINNIDFDAIVYDIDYVTHLSSSVNDIDI
jgi:cysteinyl-tRNA synthetase